MSSSPESTEEKPEKEKPKWMTFKFFVMIAAIIFFFSIIILAYFKVGCTCCCVPYCSGEMWYDCTIGACS